MVVLSQNAKNHLHSHLMLLSLRLLSPILWLLLTTFSAFCQSVDLQARYDSARAQFQQFEKKHGGFIQTRNVKMHYLQWGNPKNLPLIWIHGSFTNAYELASHAEELSKKGYYVLAIDYYGHGQTKIPPHEVSLYHVADDISYLMDAKKIPKAVIGGWSRGGFIATAFYDAYPQKVLGLILEDGGSVATNTHYHELPDSTLQTRIKNLFHDRVSYPYFDTQFEAYKAFYDSSASGSQFELLAWLGVGKNGKWTIGEGLESLFHMSNSNTFLETILRPTQATLFGESMSLIEPKIVYRNLGAPILILDPTSEQDLFPFEKANAQLQKQHPTLITHKIYQNTGHNIHYEKPKEFLKDILLFLSRLKK